MLSKQVLALGSVLQIGAISVQSFGGLFGGGSSNNQRTNGIESTWGSEQKFDETYYTCNGMIVGKYSQLKRVTEVTLNQAAFANPDRFKQIDFPQEKTGMRKARRNAEQLKKFFDVLLKKYQHVSFNQYYKIRALEINSYPGKDESKMSAPQYNAVCEQSFLKWIQFFTQIPGQTQPAAQQAVQPVQSAAVQPVQSADPRPAPPPLPPTEEIVEAIYDYDHGEIGFLQIHVGDEIVVTDKSGQGWWNGYKRNDPAQKPGLFPANYVQVKQQETDAQRVAREAEEKRVQEQVERMAREAEEKRVQAEKAERERKEAKEQEKWRQINELKAEEQARLDAVARDEGLLALGVWEACVTDDGSFKFYYHNNQTNVAQYECPVEQARAARPAPPPLPSHNTAADASRPPPPPPPAFSPPVAQGSSSALPPAPSAGGLMGQIAGGVTLRSAANTPAPAPVPAPALTLAQQIASATLRPAGDQVPIVQAPPPQKTPMQARLDAIAAACKRDDSDDSDQEFQDE